MGLKSKAYNTPPPPGHALEKKIRGGLAKMQCHKVCFFASNNTTAIDKWTIKNAMQMKWLTEGGQFHGKQQMQQELTNTCGSYTPE